MDTGEQERAALDAWRGKQAIAACASGFRATDWLSVFLEYRRLVRENITPESEA